MVSVARLLAPSGSGVDEETVAVFDRTAGAAAVTVTLMVMVAEPAEPILPRGAEIGGVFSPTFGPAHVPWVELQERNVVPTGSGSLTITFVAAPGPALLTVIV